MPVDRSKQTPQEWYTYEVQSALNACQHYLDKVIRVETTDVHERALHQGNLRILSERLEAWLNSGQTDTVQAWRDSARLIYDASRFTGLAAIWLVEISQDR